MPHTESQQSSVDLAPGPSAQPADGLPADELPVAGLPVAGLPVAGSGVEGPEAAGLPVAGLEVAGLEVDGLGVDGLEVEPPVGADPLLWRLAYGLHRDHRAQPDGTCVTCRQSWPCPPRGLADRGLSAARTPPGAPG